MRTGFRNSFLSGTPHRTLTWHGAKPATGIPAAAREARYHLLADAAADFGLIIWVYRRRSGRDDRHARRPRRRRQHRRYSGMASATLYDRRIWVLRPFLRAARGDRDYLGRAGLGWIDDPSNVDRRYEQVRIRQDRVPPRRCPPTKPPRGGCQDDVVNINATLIIQLLVFLTLAWVTMKFIWPPMIKAIDERREKIAAGLAAAGQGNKALESAKAQSISFEREARSMRKALSWRLKSAAKLIETQAKIDAGESAQRILARAQEDAAQEIVRAKEVLRDQMASLVVSGAEKIQSREINADNHADLLAQYKAQL